MAKLVFDQDGQRFYETGTKNCVLFRKSAQGDEYETGVAWNGITAVTESPSGAEETPLYADDIKYLSLYSAEEFGGTIEAYTYPDEFAICDGSINIAKGAYIGQQKRTPFGLCYKTKVSNDNGVDGYKLHIIYKATASPSEKAYQTINDSPEAITFSWEFKTVPTPFTIDGVDYVTSNIVINSLDFTTEAEKQALKTLEDMIYGTDPTTDPASEGTEPTLPDIATIVSTLGAVSSNG